MSLIVQKTLDHVPAKTPIKKRDPKDSGIHFVERVIKGETYLVMAQSSVEIEDEFANLYFTANSVDNLFLQPPFEPNMLLNLVQSNNILNQCVEAMEVNIDGTSHEFIPIEEGKEPDKQELASATSFFSEPFISTHFIAMRRELRRMLESVGYGFLEVLRNKNGKIAALRNVKTQHIRMVKLDDPIRVTKKIQRNGEETDITIFVRERRFAQLVGANKYTYYREYGSTRKLHRDRGKWEGSPEFPTIKPEEEATELIIFGVNPDTQTPYFLPRWINQLPSVIGSRNAEEQNLQFLDAGGMPPAIIFVQGGTMVKGATNQLNNYLSGKNKNKNRAVVVEVVSSQGSLDSSTKVDVKVERFGAERAKDAMFMKYDESTAEHVRMGFRLPSLFLGKTDSYNFATAQVAYMVAEAQVFSPERTDFDEVINKTIMKELGYTSLRFKSKPITLKDATAQLKGLELSKEVATRESYLKELNTVTGMNLDMSEVPAQNVAEGEQPLKHTKSLDEIDSKDLPASVTADHMKAPQKAKEDQTDSHLVLNEGQRVIPKPDFSKGKKEKKAAVELVGMAYDFAAMHGLIGDKPSEDRILLLKQDITTLTPEDEHAFNKLVSQYVYQDMDPTLVDVVHDALAHMS